MMGDALKYFRIMPTTFDFPDYGVRNDHLRSTTSLGPLSHTLTHTHDLRRVYGNFYDAVLKSLLIVLGNNRKDEEAQTNS